MSRGGDHFYRPGEWEQLEWASETAPLSDMSEKKNRELACRVQHLLGVSGFAEAVHVHEGGRLEAPRPPVHVSENVQK